jgi:hypothetical protein
MQTPLIAGCPHGFVRACPLTMSEPFFPWNEQS